MHGARSEAQRGGLTMSTMPTNDDKPLGGLGGIFSAQYLPALW
jgi:hypothetical protein